MKDILPEIENYFKIIQAVYGPRLFLDNALQDAEPAQAAPAKRENKQPLGKAESRPAFGPAKKSFKSSVLPQKSPELEAYFQEIKDCTKCALSATRSHFVFGHGNPKADILFVGEAPGRDEDEQGIPFVGRAGKLLDKMLQAIGLSKDDVYIANVLKCRPPQNRDPLPDEVLKCEPYLHRQMELIQPKILVALGRVAANTLLRQESALSALRNQVHTYKDKPLIVTYHPAALLRNPRWKASSWQDLKKIKKLLSES